MACSKCKLIKEHLTRRYWMLNDELLEKASRRRCGICCLILSKETRSLMAQQRLISSNLEVLRIRKICDHQHRVGYADGTIDDGTAAGLRDRSSVRIDGTPIGRWLEEKTPSTSDWSAKSLSDVKEEKY